MIAKLLSEFPSVLVKNNVDEKQWKRARYLFTNEQKYHITADRYGKIGSWLIMKGLND